MTNLAGVYGTLLEDNTSAIACKPAMPGEAMVIAEARLRHAELSRWLRQCQYRLQHSDDIKQLYYGVSGGVLAHAMA